MAKKSKGKKKMARKQYKASLLVVMIAAGVMFAASYAGAYVLGNELVTNGTFETNLNGWGYNGSTTITKDTTTFHSGVASMKVYDKAGALEAVAAQTIEAQAGNTYRVDFWYKTEPGMVGLYGKFLPGNGTGTGWADIVAATDWTHFSRDIVTGAGTATQYSVQFFPFNAGSSIWVDDVSVKQILPDPPPVPEPSALLALGTGLLGMTGFAIRSRK